MENTTHKINLMDPQKAADMIRDALKAAVAARKEWEKTDCTDNSMQREFEMRFEEYRHIRDRAKNGTLVTN